ncbi:MAG TPA: carboxypeptidase regulatory-like domain-containing protein [Bryobacteraceae bacterium]|nr:carboxypeptidase regulatory-like domain-containing protein [Bryobacteraceae bacterium]
MSRYTDSLAFCVATAIFLISPLSVKAQDARGSILGRISDPSGAVIAGADARATNASTGVTAAARSNESGSYRLPYLLPGIYTVQVETAGFKKFIREGVQVRVGDAVEVNVAMELGNAAESVEVRAETPLLSTAEASLGQVVDERRIAELPQHGSSPMDLVHLAPGTINTTNMRVRKPNQSGSASSFSADGAGLYNNEFTVDGVPNTMSYGSNALVAFVPPSTAISEFKVQTSSFDASVGHTMGALLNVGVKSGTNQLHGEGHWAVMNRVFDAPTTFQNRSGQKLPNYQDNRYGVSAGGPVAIPKVYNGRNRTFWFYAWEANPFTSPINFLTTVPTDAQRTGDLSALLSRGSNYQIYDPSTTVPAANGRYTRQPFPNNIIPTSRLDPVAKKILDYWPRANQAGTSDGLNNWFNTGPARFDSWVHLGRVDHAFSESHRAYLRLNKDFYSEDENHVFNTDYTRTIGSRYIQGMALDDVYVFSPSFLLNVRYGVTQMNFDERRATRGFDLSTLGFSQRFLGLIEKDRATFPLVQVGSWQALGNFVSGGDGGWSSQIHSLNGNFTKFLGSHSLRFGAEFRAYRENRDQRPYEVAPQLMFSSAYTRGPFDNSTAPPVGGEIAAFLLGIPGGQMVRSSSYADQHLYYAFYVHDDFKVSPRLTLNIGLRYELETPLTERFDRSVAHFAFDQTNPIEARAIANYAANPIAELPASQFRVRGGLTFANTGGNPRTLWEGENKTFMPRIGFAWEIRPKTVLRGGYGIYYNTIGVNTTTAIQSGFSQATPIQASLDNGVTYIANTANPLPNGLDAPLGAAGGLTTYLGQGISFFADRRRQPYAQRWSLGLQRALPGQWLFEGAYVGNRGTRLGVNRNLNAVPEKYLSRLPYRDIQTINYLSAQSPNPFYGIQPIYGTSISRSSLLVPYPQFGSVTVQEPIGYSWYHSAQLRLERRFSQGFTYQVSYTWSKMMQAAELLNATDARPYETIADLDRTHRLVMSAIWDLPFGRGRHFGTKLPKPVEFIAGGWQLGMVGQRQSGPPLAFGDIWTLFTGDPDNIAIPRGQRTLERYFNIDAGFNRNSAQQLASNVRVSPLRFSGLRADGQARWDFSAIKNFSITERFKTQFRAECINAWNHPNLSAPNTTVTSSAFGSVSSADVPRKWQMALKIAF